MIWALPIVIHLHPSLVVRRNSRGSSIRVAAQQCWMSGVSRLGPRVNKQNEGAGASQNRCQYVAGSWMSSLIQPWCRGQHDWTPAISVERPAPDVVDVGQRQRCFLAMATRGMSFAVFLDAASARCGRALNQFAACAPAGPVQAAT